MDQLDKDIAVADNADNRSRKKELKRRLVYL